MGTATTETGEMKDNIPEYTVKLSDVSVIELFVDGFRVNGVEHNVDQHNNEQSVTQLLKAVYEQGVTDTRNKLVIS